MSPWKEWRRWDALTEGYRRNLRRIARDLDCIETSMTVAFSHELAENPHYRKVVNRFFGKTREGWEVACGTDRGLYNRTRVMPMEMLLEAVALSRKWMD